MKKKNTHINKFAGNLLLERSRADNFSIKALA